MLKRRKYTEKEAGIGPFKKNYSAQKWPESITHCVSLCKCTSNELEFNQFSNSKIRFLRVTSVHCLIYREHLAKAS